jgi:hypothetical protein
MIDLIHLAISMTEIDTGIELSDQERKELVEKMLVKLQDV